MFEGAPVSSSAGSDTECFRWFEKSISSPPLPFNSQLGDSTSLKSWRSLRKFHYKGNISLADVRALIQALLHYVDSCTLNDTHKTLPRTGATVSD